MKLVKTSDAILLAYKTFELGALNINKRTLLSVFGKPTYDNDDYVVWYVSIENNGITDNYTIALKFNGLLKSHELDTDKRESFEIRTEDEATSLNTLKEFIIERVFEIIKK